MGMQTGDSGDLASEINVTPMIDVMLVLLVIFMIVAPVMKHSGVDLELPQTNAPEVDDKDGPLVLRIDPQGRLYLGDSETRIKWAELEVKLSANPRVQQKSALYVEAHRELDYGVVVTAMALAKNAGVQKVMLMTSPTDRIPVEELDARP